MRRTADDVVRAMRRTLKAEIELQAAHAMNDFERAWKAAVTLRSGIHQTRRLVDEYEREQRCQLQSRGSSAR